MNCDDNFHPCWKLLATYRRVWSLWFLLGEGYLIRLFRARVKRAPSLLSDGGTTFTVVPREQGRVPGFPG